MKIASHRALLVGTAMTVLFAAPTFAFALGSGGGGAGGAGGVGGSVGAHGGTAGARGGIHAGGTAGIGAGPGGAGRISSVTGMGAGGHASATPHLDDNNGLDRAIAREIGGEGTGSGKASAEAVDKQLQRDIAKFDQEQGLNTRNTDLGQPGSAAGTGGSATATTGAAGTGGNTANTGGASANNAGGNAGGQNANNANNTNPNNPNNPNSAASQETTLQEQQLGLTPGVPPTGAGAATATTNGTQSSTTPFSSVAPAPETSTSPSTGEALGSQGTVGSPEQLSGTLGATNETALRNFFNSNRPEGPSIPFSSSGVNLTIGAQAPDSVQLAPLPQAAAADLPPGNYGYFVYGDDVVITNLDNREIVDVLNGAA